MKKFSFIGLTATIFSTLLLSFAAAIPANAATTVSPSNVLNPGGTNSTAITASLDSLPSSVYAFGVRIFGGTFVTPVAAPGVAMTTSSSSPTQCASSGISIQTGASVSGFCIALVSPTTRVFLYATPSNVNPSGTATFTFATGSIQFDASAPAGGYRVEPYYQTSSSAGSAVTLASIPLTTASSSNTVVFDANGGSGAMVDQSASSSTALSLNAFTRSGYTFSGWNTATDGSGSAYADGASFPFSANTTLYAQWTASLANTGFDSSLYLIGALLLGLSGGALMLIARRKRSN